MEKQASTPGPWRLMPSDSGRVFAFCNERNAILRFEGSEANARRIVQCVNSHDDLVLALDKLAHYAECQVAAFSSGRPHLDMTLFPSLCREARAAINKATST